MCFGLEESGELTYYVNGVFVRGKRGRNLIVNKINEIFRKEFPEQVLRNAWEKDLLNVIAHTNSVSYKEFENGISGKYVINCLNGKFVVSHPRSEHSFIGQIPHEATIHRYRTFRQFPVNYDPEATCLKIERFIIEIFGADKLPFIYEMIGYMLLHTNEQQKSFILYGEAGTGKTTFLELLEIFIGTSNISHVSLQKLGDRFNRSNLRDKALNIYDELQFSKIYNDSYSFFKQAVTNKTLTGELKGIQGEDTWKNAIKLLFACNQLPFVPEHANHDLYRRVILIPCKNVISKQNKKMLEEITTDDELSGLLNRAIQGIYNLYERGGFDPIWSNIDRVQDIWELSSQPVKLFVEEHCVLEKSVDNVIDVKEFRKALNRFRKDNNAIEVSQSKITRAFKDSEYKVELRKHRKGGIDYSEYVGVSINPESDYYDLTIEATNKPTGTIMDEFIKLKV